MTILSQLQHRRFLRNFFLYLIQTLSISSIIFNIHLEIIQLAYGIPLLAFICFLIGLFIEKVKNVLYITFLSVPTATLLVLIFIGFPALVGVIQNGDTFWLMLTFSLSKIVVLSVISFITVIASTLIGSFMSGTFQ